MQPRVRATTQFSVQVGKPLAAAVAKVFDGQLLTVSDGLARGLAMWLESIGEVELSAMMADGRGTQPRRPWRMRGGK